ncbi:Uncharacterized protein Adt_42116 [Abeliophyllum distichum]|uniref:Uncharacterized protein n=1 Tax=Abeliophyllum distichum TaxID=126358 RepID=A0ABD1PQR6_9LAMI
MAANCNILKIKKVHDAIDDHHKELLHQSCLQKLFQVRCMQFSSYILLQMVNSVNTDKVWFWLGNEKMARFSLSEFAIIIRLLNKYFEGRSMVIPPKVEIALEQCIVMEDKYKLGLVLIVKTVWRCKPDKISIDTFF